MRALAALTAVVAIAACTLTIDTENLTGGDTDAGGDAKSDTPDAPTCDGATCWSEAVVVKQADIAPCGSTSTDMLGCRRKIHDFCVAKNPCCFVGGFGPVEYPNATEATIVCLAGKVYTSPATEVLAPGCTVAGLGSRGCDAAIHTASKKRGHATAVLQTVGPDQTLTLVGLAPADTYANPGIPWGDLTKLEPKCTSSTADSQACTTAVHRWCSSDIVALLTGFGPVAIDTSGVTMMCLY